MERKKLKLMLFLMIIISLFGCSLLDNSQKDNSSINPAGNSTINIKASGIRLYTNTGRAADDSPIIVAGLPDNIYKVVVTLSGENIPAPIIYNLVEINGVWQGILVNVPAGPATISVEAFDDTDTLLYENSVNITIENHETLNLNLTLLPVDPPPGFNVKAPQIDLVNISTDKVAPGDQVRLEVYAHDPAPGGPLTYMWATNPVANGFDDRMSATPIWTAPATEGIYQLTVTVIDQEFLVDHVTVDIDVNAQYGNGNASVVLGTNDFPVINSIIADPTRIDKGGSTQLFVDATDPDGDSLTFSWTSDLDGTFDNPASGNPVFTVGAGVDYGPCVLTVAISDGTLTSTGSIQINITAEPEVNHEPAVSSAFQSADRVSPNGVIRYIIRARDPEGTALTFTWSTDDGTLGASTDVQNGLDYESAIEWTAPAAGPGSYIIRVTITDAEGLAVTFSYQPVVMQ